MLVKRSSGVNRYQNNKMMEAKAEIDSFINSYDRARMSNLIRVKKCLAILRTKGLRVDITEYVDEPAPQSKKLMFLAVLQ